MRFYSHKTTILPANWKVVIDAFNEGYHVQGTHPQILPWTDDVNMEYEQFGTHAHYGRLPSSRRQLRPSPRLGIPDEEVDEWEILAGLVGGLGGLFYRDERRIVDELRGAELPPADPSRGVPATAAGPARLAGIRRLGILPRPDDQC